MFDISLVTQRTLGEIAICTVALVLVYYFIYMYYVNRKKGECKHLTTIKLSSIERQKCADCNEMIYWPLKEGQQPLVSSSRDKRYK